MKVVCINNNYSEEGLIIDEVYVVLHESYYEEGLTIGKIYETVKYKYVENIDKWYRLINDYNYIKHYPKKWFKPLSEIRNDKINKILK